MLTYLSELIPFMGSFLLSSLVIANAFFIYSLITKKFENDGKSKLLICLKINLTVIFAYSTVMGVSFLLVYGVSSIPDSVLTILWIAAFITVASILLFRLNRLIKNRRML